MQTIEAAAERLRQPAVGAPPPPPVYPVRVKPAPAALAIKTRVLGELAETAAPAIAAAPGPAVPGPRHPAWLLAAALAGAAATLGIQALLPGGPGQGAPAGPAQPVATAAAPASVAPAPVAPATVALTTPPAAVMPAVPAPASGPAADPLAEVREVVAQWATVWSARDIAGYLDFYARGFRPERGQTRPAWEAQRRARLAGATAIHVGVRDLELAAAGPDRIVARFVQDYTAGAYRETGTAKRLVLEREDGRWRIVAEGAAP